MIIVRKAAPGLSEATLSRFVTRAMRAVGLRHGVNILLTTNREMRSLNLRFRGKETPTDVLSFPAPAGMDAHLSGDIAISTEMAAQNAKRLGHSAAAEVKILTLHGLLHLAGYDHERDNGTMARKEHRLRIKLALPHGLIERSHAEAGDLSATPGGVRKPNASRSGVPTRKSPRRP